MEAEAIVTYVVCDDVIKNLKVKKMAGQSRYLY